MKPLALILALIAVCAPVALAQAASPLTTQPATQPARELKFQSLGDESAVPWPGRNSAAELIRPSYAAVVTTAFEPGSWIRPEDANAWLRGPHPELDGLSPQQEAFLQQHVHIATGRRVPVSVGNIGYSVPEFEFYALSRADARQMATLFLQFLDYVVQRRVDEARQLLAKSLQDLKELPAQIEQLAVQEKQVADEALALVGRDPWNSVAWAKFVEERQPLFRALEIERTGQIARLRKLQEYMVQQTQPAATHGGRAAATEPNPAVLTSLETMLVELSVEMAGTQAKRDAIEKEIAPYQRRLELSTKLENIRKEKSSLEKSLQKARDNVVRLPEQLANPPREMRPVKIKDNTIYVVPVRAWPDTRPADESPG